jgi:hypothetical protein
METVEKKIEDGIPIPPPSRRYAVLAQLEVGQSVLLDDLPPNRLSSLLAYHQRAQGKQFVQRKVNGGRRVWRTK